MTSSLGATEVAKLRLDSTGILKFLSGYQAVIDVKTTLAYQLRFGDVIAGYRKRLIEQGQLLRITIIGPHHLLGVMTLPIWKAQIRGSRYAWDVRLISIEALLRLLNVKEELEDPTIVKKIHEILIPREFTSPT